MTFVYTFLSSKVILRGVIPKNNSTMDIIQRPSDRALESERHVPDFQFHFQCQDVKYTFIKIEPKLHNQCNAQIVKLSIFPTVENCLLEFQSYYSAEPEVKVVKYGKA